MIRMQNCQVSVWPRPQLSRPFGLDQTLIETKAPSSINESGKQFLQHASISKLCAKSMGDCELLHEVRVDAQWIDQTLI
jgi:hypothetical protein